MAEFHPSEAVSHLLFHSPVGFYLLAVVMNIAVIVFIHIQVSA
jgi:hypothetical protein